MRDIKLKPNKTFAKSFEGEIERQMETGASIKH